MIGIALDMGERPLRSGHPRRGRVHDHATSDRTVRAGVARLHHAIEFEWPDCSGMGCLDAAEAERAERRAGETRPGAAEQLSPRQVIQHAYLPVPKCLADNSSGM